MTDQTPWCCTGRVSECPLCPQYGTSLLDPCPGHAVNDNTQTVVDTARLHAERRHPGYEYATTTGPRKQWDDADVPPHGDNGEPDTTWQPNLDAGYPGAGWERFDYTEEAYWRRPKAAAAPAGTDPEDEAGHLPSQQPESVQLRADANEWRRKAISRSLTISRLRGTIDALTDLADEKITDPGARGDGYREAIGDLREVLREYGHLDGETTAAPAATATCCVCAGGPVVYRNFREQPFCQLCANCECAENPCVRTGINDPAVSSEAAAAPTTPDGGPTVAEAAQDDRNCNLQKGGE